MNKYVFYICIRIYVLFVYVYIYIGCMYCKHVHDKYQTRITGEKQKRFATIILDMYVYIYVYVDMSVDVNIHVYIYTYIHIYMCIKNIYIY